MGVPKPTEMTIRDLLQEQLRKCGVTVVPEFSVLTPDGRHMMPDMLLKNGAQYVVETKLGVEAKLLDAMMKLYEYSKYVTEARGAFAVLFPEELRRPWPHDMIVSIATSPKTEYVVTAIFKDLRPSQRFVGNLGKVAGWMAEQVLRAPIVEADTGFAIRVLRDAVSFITASVRQLRDKELEDIFGGKTVFENILQYEEGRYPLEEMRQAATYLLVNQLLFYHVLSRMDTSFSAVDEEKVRKPADLAQYFKPVLKRDYSSIFGFDVASRLPDSASDVVKKVVMVVKALAPEKIRHDLLGKVFHELIPFETRKAVAAFYTNNEAAEILAQLAIDKPDAKVMDLAVGSGTLLVAAYRRKRELLLKTKGTFELEDHKRFLEQDLTGIDIMPFAAHLAVVHLSLQALLYETEKVRVAVWDSTELKPGQTIPAIWTELKAAYRRPTLDMFAKGGLTEEAYVTKGAITLEGIGGEKIPLEQADVVIMNPPFTRQERLPKNYKTALEKRLQEYEKYLHGQLGLYGYFIFLADKFVKDGGRMALVLPASVLRVQSALGIRKLFTENYHVEYIITTWQRAAFSEGAQFREILIVARKLNSEMKPQDYLCGIVKLKTLPTGLGQAKIMADKIIKSIVHTSRQGIALDEESMTIKVVSMQKLKRDQKNLFKYISSQQEKTEEIWNNIAAKAKKEVAPFKDVLKDIDGKIFEGARARSQMIHTSIGSLFIVREVARANKREDLWVSKDESKQILTVENLTTHDTINMPKKSLVFGLRRLSGINTIDLSEKLDYVLVNSFRGWENYFLKQDTNRLTKEMPVWQRYIEERLSKLAVAFRFDISAKGTKLFAWYSSNPMAGCGVVWNIQGLSEEHAKILSLWFNSTVYALEIYLNRVETRGAWMQLHKYVMDDLLAIHPLKLSSKQKNMILKTFEEIKGVEFPSFLKQLKEKFSARVTIDRTILGVLGFGDVEIDRILHSLYPALANEIQQLKILMQG